MAHLTLRGAQTHNLKQIDLDLPLGTWIALTGLSGSGKTTLAFDVLHREGQRRYLGALSAKARHYLGKLGAADLETLTGLPVTLATGQGALTPSPRSTVGTLTGLLDLLRLLYARDGVHPTATDLSRSDFSFNQDRGACAACKGLGIEDLVDPLLLVADGSRSLRDGALRPTLANGYTVYSQVTLEVMNTICAAHGFDVDTPWQQLSDAQRDVIFYGTKALTVPFGKHSIASRMKWEGITARPREEGFYRGLIPVIEETLKRDRNPNILRFVRSVDCSVCDGTRLGPIGRETTVGPWTLPELLAKPATALSATLDQLPASAVLDALRPAVDRRLRRMGQLSLGHLALNRISTTLSGGEGQRLRLAAQLNAQLGGMLVILDEPTLGLHPSAQQGMAEILEELRALGNTLLVVDHDPHMVQRADHWLALGPGAGPHGGEVTHAGPMPDKALQHGLSKPVDREHVGQIRLSGASLHNLDGVELSVPLSALTVLSGPSGAGKSSLVFGTLLPALQGKPGGPYVALHGVPDSLSVQWVDAKPIGRTPRSTPATYTGLFDLVRKRFAATPAAKSRGFKASHFSYNAKAGRCPVCEGLGLQRVGLHLLQDVEVPCPACAGQRYAAEVLQVELRGQHIGAVLDLTVDEAEAFFADDPPIHAICVALSQLGLGYLHLGQASSTLSRGEAQRVRLATLLGKPPRSASVVLLDEPDRGLHPDDVARLLTCLGQLVEAGHTVLAVSHHPMVWSAADHRVALRDGRLASPDAVPSHPPRAERPPAHLPKQITLRGVRTHNLANLDVCIPHGQITAITGVSGSGKTSLAYDTLAAAAWSRFAESLPFQVRRFMRQLPAPNLDSAEGLTPVLALKQGQGRAGPRATVGTLSEIDAGLRLLWSRLGVDEGQPTGLSASHFSPNQTMGACPSCAGRGSVLRCDPERLVTQPERALDEGAMEGTKPGAFFGEPDGQYMQTLRAAAKSAGLDVDVPYADLTPAARQLALFGAGEAVFDVEWNYRRGKRTGSHSFKGPWLGLNALVEHEAKVRAKRKNAAEWAVPLAPIPCEECDGERLSEEARRVTVGPLRLPQASALELEALDRALSDLQLPQAQTAVLEAIRPGLQAKLSTLIELGLGHLTLARPSESLSTGELQRLRLAGVLDSALTQLTLVLDEPGTGLDDARLEGLLKRLRAFCDQGNTVVMVCHRQVLIDGAASVLTLGPGPGEQGGRLIQAAPEVSFPTRPASPPGGRFQIRGARAHHLKGIDLDLPNRGLVAVTGPSGSGKSSLLFDVIAASAAAGRPQHCDAIDGLEHFAAVRSSRATPSRSPLSTLDLTKAVQALFHGVGSGLSRSAFSFHSPAGRCPACKGAGSLNVAMDFMADLSLDCASCGGQRYKPEVLAVNWRGMNVAEFLNAPVASLVPKLPAGALADAVTAMCGIGLGHLNLGRPPAMLSGGEHQRLLLASALAQPNGPSLFVLDEPGSGLHPQDLARLLEVLYALIEDGALVLMSTHRKRLVGGAHWQVDLGPGGGEDGGVLMAAGPR